MDPAGWYRYYVLAVLLLVCSHNLLVRNLPSYLVAVQVPGCEAVCGGAHQKPLCHASGATGEPVSLAEAARTARQWADSLWEVSSLSPSEKQGFFACQLCRSQTTSYANPEKGNLDATYFNLADGACLSAQQYGVLVGYGFAAVFAFATVPASIFVGATPRRFAISGALAAWSAATAVQAGAHSFVYLLICRLVLGLAQAFAMPAAISIALDYFQDAESTAVSVLSAGLYLGAGGASLAIILAEGMGWRTTCLVAGAAGLVLSVLLCATVEEPPRAEGQSDVRIRMVCEQVFKKRVPRLLVVAGSLKLLAGVCLAAYLPTWYFRRQAWGFTTWGYALGNAAALSASGLFSAVLGGRLADVWSRWDIRAPCWVALSGTLLAIPLLCFVVASGTMWVSLVCLFAAMLCSECWFGATISLLQAAVPRSHRGQTVAVFLCVSMLFANGGPAFLSWFDPGDEELSTWLISLCLLANCFAAIAFLLVAREVGIDPVAADLGRKFDTEGSRLPLLRGGVPERTGTVHWGFM